jgi:hypothetical protein
MESGFFLIRAPTDSGRQIVLVVEALGLKSATILSSA